MAAGDSKLIKLCHQAAEAVVFYPAWAVPLMLVVAPLEPLVQPLALTAAAAAVGALLVVAEAAALAAQAERRYLGHLRR